MLREFAPVYPSSRLTRSLAVRAAPSIHLGFRSEHSCPALTAACKIGLRLAGYQQVPKARGLESFLVLGTTDRAAGSRTEGMLGFSFRTVTSNDRKVTSVANGHPEMQQKIAL